MDNINKKPNVNIPRSILPEKEETLTGKVRNLLGKMDTDKNVVPKELRRLKVNKVLIKRSALILNFSAMDINLNFALQLSVNGRSFQRNITMGPGNSRITVELDDKILQEIHLVKELNILIDGDYEGNRWKVLELTLSLDGLEQDEEEVHSFLRQMYREKSKELQLLKAKRNYSELFAKITPAMQLLAGLYHYYLKNGINDNTIANKLEYIIGDNFSNAVINAGFELENRTFQVRRSSMQALTENTGLREDDNRSEGYLPVKDMLKVKRAFEASANEMKAYQVYEVCERVCGLLAGPISEIRILITEGNWNRQILEEQIGQILSAYIRNDFEFRYYEDLLPDSEETMKFLKGDEWSLEYPALYKDGQVYCDLVGRKR